MKKRLLSMVFALLMLMSLLVLPVSAEEFSGSCGSNATWVFDPATATLTISGSGAMADHDIGLWYEAPYRADITRVVVEEGITAIGKCAFFGFSGLQHLQLPESLIRIEERAFASCHSLESIQLPNNLQCIGAQAFRSCGLTSLTLPNSLTECGSDAFSLCDELTNITLSNNLSTIPKGMFSSCGTLTAVTIPAGVKEISTRAFHMSEKLNVINFLGDAPTFNKSAFSDNTLMAYYPAGNPTWTQDKLQDYGGKITWLPSGDTALSGTFGRSSTLNWKLEDGTLTISGDGYMDGFGKKETPWYPYRGMIKKIVLSGKIEDIYSYAFLDCTELTDIQWTNTVRVVFDGAFAGCVSLKTVTLPESVTVLGGHTFDGCTALTTVNLPSSLKEIDGYAFNNCESLKTLTIPASVQEIGRSVFNCGVHTIYFKGNFPKYLCKVEYGPGSFSYFTGIVYYPADNSTWTAAKIKEQTDMYGDNVKFVASAELNTSGKPSGGTVKPNTPSQVPPTTAPTVPEPTAPTVPETTSPTVPETTASTMPETTTPVVAPSAPESTGATTQSPPVPDTPPTASHSLWIWVLVSGVIVASGAIATVILLKKRQK